MSRHPVAALLILSAFLIIAGCATTPQDTKAPDAPDPSPADEAYARGMAEYAGANYRVAEECFREAHASLYRNG